MQTASVQGGVWRRRHRKLFGCLVIVLASAAPGDVSPVRLDPQAARPPVAQRVPWVVKVHGETYVDNYHWLRERSNPDVLAYIKAENDYTSAVMKPTATLQETLFREMLSRYRESDLSAPYRMGDYDYYTRTEAARAYPIWCRKRANTNKEEVVLDLNQLATGHTFLRVHQHAFSDDGNFLAYTTDFTGSRQFELHIRDLRTGRDLPDRVPNVRTLAWAADNKTILYVGDDAAQRPYRLLRHTLGGERDELLYEERDEVFRVYVSRSQDKEYLLISSESLSTNETRVVPSAAPTEPLRLLLPRREGFRYDVQHRGGEFFLRTNIGAEDYRIVAAPEANPGPEHWRDVVPSRPGVVVENMMLFAHHAVVIQRQEGLPTLLVLDLDRERQHVVKFPKPPYTVHFDVNPDFSAEVVRLRYTSFVTPETIYTYDMETRRLSKLKQTEVPGGFDPDDYVVEWTNAEAPDGARVPISLVYRRGVPKDGSAPMLLFGYGAYGEALAVTFDPLRKSLLDRGVIYAQAHVRGGGDLGVRWQLQGKLLAKRNTFTDFIAVAEGLIARKYTSSDRLAIQSLSAGGALVGAVVNMRPDLFKAAVLQGPFLDVLNTSLDPTLPLTVPEYLEWGDPRKKEEYENLKSYCPYTNLAPCAHPAILLLTSLDDRQVMYWEPVKYVAKLRAIGTGRSPLLLKVGVGVGHTGPSGLQGRLREKAFVYAFILSQIAAGN
jgi:oligopeptidase B